MADNKINQTILNDFIATVKEKPSLSDVDVFKYFPEFNNDKALLDAAWSYKSTVDSKKYKNLNEINSKFPEFFPSTSVTKPIEEPGFLEESFDFLKSIPVGIFNYFAPDTASSKDAESIIKSEQAQERSAQPKAPDLAKALEKDKALFDSFRTNAAFDFQKQGIQYDDALLNQEAVKRLNDLGYNQEPFSPENPTLVFKQNAPKLNLQQIDDLRSKAAQDYASKINELQGEMPYAARFFSGEGRGWDLFEGALSPTETADDIRKRKDELKKLKEEKTEIDEQYKAAKSFQDNIYTASENGVMSGFISTQIDPKDALADPDGAYSVIQNSYQKLFSDDQIAKAKSSPEAKQAYKKALIEKSVFLNNEFNENALVQLKAMEEGKVNTDVIAEKLGLDFLQTEGEKERFLRGYSSIDEQYHLSQQLKIEKEPIIQSINQDRAYKDMYDQAMKDYLDNKKIGKNINIEDKVLDEAWFKSAMKASAALDQSIKKKQDDLGYLESVEVNDTKEFKQFQENQEILNETGDKSRFVTTLLESGKDLLRAGEKINDFLFLTLGTDDDETVDFRGEKLTREDINAAKLYKPLRRIDQGYELISKIGESTERVKSTEAEAIRIFDEEGRFSPDIDLAALAGVSLDVAVTSRLLGFTAVAEELTVGAALKTLLKPSEIAIKELTKTGARNIASEMAKRSIIKGSNVTLGYIAPTNLLLGSESIGRYIKKGYNFDQSFSLSLIDNTIEALTEVISPNDALIVKNMILKGEIKTAKELAENEIYREAFKKGYKAWTGKTLSDKVYNTIKAYGPSAKEATKVLLEETGEEITGEALRSVAYRTGLTQENAILDEPGNFTATNIANIAISTMATMLWTGKQAFSQDLQQRDIAQSQYRYSVGKNVAPYVNATLDLLSKDEITDEEAKRRLKAITEFESLYNFSDLFAEASRGYNDLNENEKETLKQRTFVNAARKTELEKAILEAPTEEEKGALIELLDKTNIELNDLRLGLYKTDEDRIKSRTDSTNYFINENSVKSFSNLKQIDNLTAKYEGYKRIEKDEALKKTYDNAIKLLQDRKAEVLKSQQEELKTESEKTADNINKGVIKIKDARGVEKELQIGKKYIVGRQIAFGKANPVRFPEVTFLGYKIGENGEVEKDEKGSPIVIAETVNTRGEKVTVERPISTFEDYNLGTQEALRATSAGRFYDKFKSKKFVLSFKDSKGASNWIFNNLVKQAKQDLEGVDEVEGYLSAETEKGKPVIYFNFINPKTGKEVYYKLTDKMIDYAQKKGGYLKPKERTFVTPKGEKIIKVGQYEDLTIEEMEEMGFFTAEELEDYKKYIEKEDFSDLKNERLSQERRRRNYLNQYIEKISAKLTKTLESIAKINTSLPENKQLIETLNNLKSYLNIVKIQTVKIDELEKVLPKTKVNQFKKLTSSYDKVIFLKAEITSRIESISKKIESDSKKLQELEEEKAVIQPVIDQEIAFLEEIDIEEFDYSESLVPQLKQKREALKEALKENNRLIEEARGNISTFEKVIASLKEAIEKLFNSIERIIDPEGFIKTTEELRKNITEANSSINSFNAAIIELESKGKKLDNDVKRYNKLINNFQKLEAEHNKKVSGFLKDKIKEFLFAQQASADETSTGDNAEDKAAARDEDSAKKYFEDLFSTSTSFGENYEKELKDPKNNYANARLDFFFNNFKQSFEDVVLIPINKKNAEKFGLTGILYEPEIDTDVKLVVAKKTNDGYMFLDMNGNPIKADKDGKVSPDQVIYTSLQKASLTNSQGELKYNLKDFKDLKESFPNEAARKAEIERIANEELQKYAKFRQGIVDSDNPPVFVIGDISRGIPQYDKEGKEISRNTLRGNLAPANTTSFQGKIQIADKANPNGSKLGNLSFKSKNINMPLGRPVYVDNKNNIFQFLDNHPFSQKQKEALVAILKQMASDIIENYNNKKVDPTVQVVPTKYVKFLEGVVYWRNPYKNVNNAPQDPATIKPNQMWLDFTDGEAMLMIGGNKIGDNKIALKDLITGDVFIEGLIEPLYHNTSMKAFGKPFTEYYLEGNKLKERIWKSYENYLLSDKYPDGTTRGESEIPLTTSVIPNDSPFDENGKFKENYNPQYRSRYFIFTAPGLERPKINKVKKVVQETQTPAPTKTSKKSPDVVKSVNEQIENILNNLPENVKLAKQKTYQSWKDLAGKLKENTVYTYSLTSERLIEKNDNNPDLFTFTIKFDKDGNVKIDSFNLNLSENLKNAITGVLPTFEITEENLESVLNFFGYNNSNAIKLSSFTIIDNFTISDVPTVVQKSATEPAPAQPAAATDADTKTPIEGLNERLDGYGNATLVFSSDFFEGERPKGKLNGFKALLSKLRENIIVLADVNWNDFNFFLSKEDIEKLNALKPLAEELDTINTLKISSKDTRTVAVEKRYAALTNQLANEFVDIIGKHVEQQLGKKITSSKPKVSGVSTDAKADIERRRQEDNKSPVRQSVKYKLQNKIGGIDNPTQGNEIPTLSEALKIAGSKISNPIKIKEGEITHIVFDQEESTFRFTYKGTKFAAFYIANARGNVRWEIAKLNDKTGTYQSISLDELKNINEKYGSQKDLLLSLGAKNLVEDIENFEKVEYSKEDKSSGNGIIPLENTVSAEQIRLGKKYGVTYTLEDFLKQYDAELAASEGKKEEKATEKPKETPVDLDDVADDDDDKGGYRIAKGEAKVRENIEKARQWVKERFSNVDFSTVQGLVDGVAWGKFVKNGIILSEAAEVGTVYHEAFEAVAAMFLNKRQWNELTREFKSRKGSYIDRETGKLVKFSEATDHQIKEQVAEEYRDYEMSGGKLTIPGQYKTNSLFRRIWNAIKALLFGDPKNIEDLFRKISAAEFKDKAPVKWNRPFNLEKSYRIANLQDDLFFSQLNKSLSLYALRNIFGKTNSFGSIFKMDKKQYLQMFQEVKEQLNKDYFFVKNKSGDYIKITDFTRFKDVNEALDNYDEFFDALLKFRPKGQKAKSLPLVIKRIFATVEEENLTDEQYVAKVKNKVKDALLAYSYINDNWEQIVNKNKEYLEKFKISYEGEIIIEDAQTNEDDEAKEEDTEDSASLTEQEKKESVGRDEYTKDPFSVSLKDRANSKIKLLIATLPVSVNLRNAQGQIVTVEKLNDLGLPEVVDFSKTFRKVVSTVIEQPSLLDQLKALKEASLMHPELANLYNRLGGDKTVQEISEDPDLWNLRLNFNQTFNKQRFGFSRLLMKEEEKKVGDNKITTLLSNLIDSLQSSSYKAIEKRFITQFKEVALKNPQWLDVSTYNIPASVVPKETLRDSRDYIPYLEAIGFNIPYDIDSLSQEDQEDLFATINSIATFIRGGTAKLEKLKNFNFSKHVADLARIEYKITKDAGEVQHKNTEGMSQSNDISQNSLSIVFKGLNFAKNITSFQLDFPRFNDVFTQNALWRSLYFEEGGEKNNIKIRVESAEGIIETNSRGKHTSKLNYGQRLLQEFLYNIVGDSKNFRTPGFYVITPADIKTEEVIKYGKVLVEQDYIESETGVFDNFLKGYLIDEINLARELSQDDRGLKAYKSIISTPGGKRTVAKSLRMFNDILKFDYTDIIDNPDLDVNDWIQENKEEILKNINEYFETEVDDTFELFKSEGIITLNPKTKMYDLLGMDTQMLPYLDSLFGTELQKSFEKTGEVSISEKDIKAIIKYRAVNYFVNVNEQSKLFFGDFGQFGDLTKRIKSFVSSRETTAFDNYSTNGEVYTKPARALMNKIKYTDELGNVEEVEISEEVPGYQSFESSFKASTIQDVETVERSLPYIQEVHQESLANDLFFSSFKSLPDPVRKKISELVSRFVKPFTEVNEADGQAYMTLPLYRQFLHRSSMWNDDLQELYDYHMAYERSKRNQYSNYTNGDAIKEIDKKILEKGNPNEKRILEGKEPLSYPVIKPIGAGVRPGNKFITTLDKCSVMPLHYKLLEGKPSLDMYLSAIDQDVQYFRFKSAHKVGTPAEMQKTYNNEGTPNTIVQTDELSFQDYAIQVETRTFKDAIARGTQLLKLAFINLMEASIPVDFIKQTQSEFQDRINELKESITEDFNYDDYVSKWKDLRDEITTEAKKQWDLLTNQEKREKSPIFEAVDDHDKVLSALTNRYFNNVSEEFSIVKNENDTYKISDYSKFKEAIVKQLKDRNAAENLLRQLEIENGKFVQPFDFIIGADKLEPILMAIINNNVTQPKVKGKSLAQIASTFFEDKARTWVKKIANEDGTFTYEKVENPESTEGLYLTSSDLIFYGDDIVEENGIARLATEKEIKEGKSKKANFMEIMLPPIFKDAQGNFITDINKIDPELIKIAGYRIPAQELAAAESIRIKGFLPLEYQNGVVVPSSITAKAGSDFDIDKLNMYLYHYYIDLKTGLPKKIKFLDTSNSTPEERYRNYRRRNKEVAEIYKKYADDIKKIDTSLQKSWQIQTGQLSKMIEKKQLSEKEIEDLFYAKREKEIQLAFEKADVKESSLLLKDLEEGYKEDPSSTDLMAQLAGYEGDMFNVLNQAALELEEKQNNVLIVEDELQSIENKIKSLSSEKFKKADIQEKVKRRIKRQEQYLSEKQELLKQRTDEINLLVPDITFEEFSKLSIEDQNSQKALENRYIDILLRLLSFEENKNRMMTPNSAATLIALAEKMEELKKDVKKLKLGGNKQDQKFGKFGSALNNSYTRRSFQVGKEGVGIGAVGVTNHAVNQFVDSAILDEKVTSIELYFPTNKQNGKTSISFKRDASGNWISNNISEIINGFVDIAKDPFIIKINGNLSTAGAYLIANKMGIPLENVALIMNQPIVEYYEELKEKGTSSIWKTKLKKAGLNSYNYPLQAVALKYGTLSDSYQQGMFTIAELEDMIKNQDSLTEQQKQDQIKIFEIYQIIQGLSDGLRQAINTYNFDTDSQKSITGVFSKLKAIASYEKDPSIYIYTEDKFFSTIRNAIVNYTSSVQSLFKVFTDKYRKHVMPIIEDLSFIIDKNTRDLALADVKRGFANYLLLTIPNVSQPGISSKDLNSGNLTLQSKLKELMLDNETSVTTRLKKLQDKMQEGKIPTNFALQELFRLVKDADKKTNNLTVFNRSKDPEYIDLMVNSLKELEQSTDPEISKLAQDIYTLALLQSGLNQSFVSISQYIPDSWFTPLAKNLMNTLDEMDPKVLDEHLKKFKSYYYANKWKDPKFTSKVSSSTRIDKNDKISTGSTITSFAPAVEVDALGKFKINSSQLAKYQIVKYLRDINGKYTPAVFQRVEYDNGDPILIQTQKGYSFLYRRVIPLGDGQYALEFTPTSQINENVEQDTNSNIIAKLAESTIQYTSLSELLEGMETKKPAAKFEPTTPVVTPTVTPIEQFVDLGKFEKLSKLEGTKADVQMRTLSDGIIIESTEANSSSETSVKTILEKTKKDNTEFNVSAQLSTRGITKAVTPLAKTVNPVIMLARNYSLRNTSLTEDTKKAIDGGIKMNAKFIFGNSSTDRAFLDYLKSKNYNNYTIYGYTSGSTDIRISESEIKPTTPTQLSTSVEREYTPENITSLKPNEVFVFGSNTEGRHGKGAALIAKNKFGAKQGQAEGLQGNSYAIITKDLSKGERSISLDKIAEGINKLADFAENNPDTKFYVTKLGSSLAGYTINEIKEQFRKVNEEGAIPNNVILPKEYEVRTTTQQPTTKPTAEDLKNPNYDPNNEPTCPF
jgi:hypothetical protein